MAWGGEPIAGLRGRSRLCVPARSCLQVEAAAVGGQAVILRRAEELPAKCALWRRATVDAAFGPLID